ncbi:nitroreductase family deazaflavin-dependent oxidoreductase [Georgenia yuyongxinii]|uniref:Nitroreductase family deazaflavin-dependent oxidoreductase n=1 Tax=Georgenia yuyongxinii TaxID=2589797 RepID=A0A5B8C131_9MICO|nr:nitroreductase family deazaflavin-dependent oxidoreductase [Georgenia yuyongxinii]QDC24439.1 nitroreductase family deazaflavin-dependent oxidoreductase [Georgenia yuyongxinii]
MSPLPRWLGRANRLVLNRVMGLVAPRLPGFAVLTHVGRRSGREHSAVVNIFRAGPGYRVALTYGREADWVRNVLAAGGCWITTRGRRVELAEPRLVHDPTVAWAPPLVRELLGLLDVPDSLSFTIRPPRG